MAVNRREFVGAAAAGAAASLLPFLAGCGNAAKAPGGELID